MFYNNPTPTNKEPHAMTNALRSEAVREYDSNGNMIHHKYSDGYEEWREYDNNGNMIHYKNSNGREYWREFDSNGNMIHYKTSNGFEEWLGVN